MTTDEIIREFFALPPEARREVEDFIAFLRQRYARENKPAAGADWREEDFVGMWKDRADLQNSAEFVRELRKNDWSK